MPLVSFVVLVVGFVVAWLVTNRDPTDLWVVNGLSIPVEVQVDGQTLALEAQTWEMIEPGGGEYEIIVTSGGRELSRERVTIDGDHVMAVYNVLGAARVVGVWYTQYGGPAGERNWELYAYDTFHDIDEEKVHLRFRPIPNSASVSGDSSRAYMRFVGATNSGDWSWRRTLAEARTRRTPDQLAEFEAALRDAMPEQFGGGGAAGGATSPGSPGGPGVAPAGNGQSAPRGAGPPGSGGKSRR